MDKPVFDYAARWQRAAALMEQHGVDALLLMKPANLAYLTGDGRPCALALLTRTLHCVVAVPACDLTSIRRTSVATELRSFKSEVEMFHGFSEVLKELDLTQATIAIEKNFFDAALYEVFVAHILPKAHVVSAAPIVSQLRMLKDATEIARIRAAAKVADSAMDAVSRALRPGVPEIEIAGEAEFAMRKAGAEGWASVTYVASGWRSAMAHGPASLKPIAPGEVVQIHVAPLVDGYTADLCRTFLVEPIAIDAANALRAYVLAQERGIAAAVPGMDLMGIDRAMAASLEHEGYGSKFLRPMFHGIGIEHEEAPIPGGHAVVHGEQKVDHVMAGMVLGVGNCGIYRDDYGVRVEDTIWVSEEGPVVLTGYPKLTQ
ncbi:Xaa-Pro peptidase family protein [Cupriavidus sp. AcVe19-1a]|uniref:M24 family metallopeptidase n=1 Tax=Cupriavidus sp. AcVe19-1a TaxID=2821359 RepID=UPI001FD871EB|nr:Xaa-Pro peptidase family protein [Cupriavidus sp. AcVe19-1a]